ncbi:MJ0042 family finger-like domain-containing protein [Methylophilus rhizosphaerae]|uniref:MJ0042 family finger-like domain-containing protein n=1 Tax=Methylophilus rhizosphaerae TaxID=492660 RepID=A0A1G9EE97_9PROT|nr:DUF3426 domain-containing protein [Methylophilus rhizosphaerae]SDK74472.1 MJ0042 family finger-like domain-containing protein [Methylophilus rhizosphaerae]
MSLITACPACHTQFEVDDAQLLAYAGKVRCGECSHVFDARASIVQAEEGLQAEMLRAEEPEQPAITENDAQAFSVVTELPVAPIDPLEPDFRIADAIPDIRPDAPVPAISWNLPAEEGPEVTIPDFLRNVSVTDDRPSLPEKTARPWLFSALSVVLLLTLLFQYLYFMRVNLAANYPATKPLLQSLCKLAHCEVALPHDIAQLTIDDADIQEHRERENVLVFSSVLINHGDVPQAYPDIELTLTNMADEPVLRKILKPTEYLTAAVSVDQGLAAQQEQPVKATLGVEDKAVTGFRVAIAY